MTTPSDTTIRDILGNTTRTNSTGRAHRAPDLSQYHGIYPPIVTPLTPDGEVDTESLTSLTNWLIAEGVHGIWACGTTGEFACFTADERERVIATVVEATAGRVPVIAGIGDGSTRLVIEHGKRAIRAGADAVAATPPYYYANSQDELLAFYRRIREKVDAPLFIYNIPSTTKVKVEIPTVVTLAAEGTVTGSKDTQNDLDYARTLLMTIRERGAQLRLFLGTRTLIDASVLIGAHGAIPAIANVVPRACVETYEAAVRGEWAVAAAAQERAVQANQFVKTSAGSAAAAGMGGFKSALKAMGVIKHATLAEPLRTPTAEDEARVAAIARQLGVLAPVPA